MLVNFLASGFLHSYLLEQLPFCPTLARRRLPISLFVRFRKKVPEFCKKFLTPLSIG